MNDLLEQKARLLGSLFLFTQFFYKQYTGRDFTISQPLGRESHQIIICRELTKVFNLETKRLLINIPPGHAKSTFLKYFIAWAYAHYADCQFLYISYSHDLAAGHTYDIKKIMQLHVYKKLFGVEIAHDSSAKDDFKTTAGGSVKAFGSAGAITGRDGGLPYVNRFSGSVIMDDMHKPDEVHSDVIREKVHKNYVETIEPRARGPKVPSISIGQRLHEDDLSAKFIEEFDGHSWKKVILKAIDDAGNVLAPDLKTKEDLLIMQKKQPYKYSSQYQQDPMPAGGGLFRREWFPLFDEEPEMLATFITADTAETSKTYNDPTVFSFWGIYRIVIHGAETDLYGLHWIDCWEEWIEPKDLRQCFLDFWAMCMRHPVKPRKAAIEKKSTGTTLVSVLKDVQGLHVIEIERTAESGSKTKRYLEIQEYISSKQVSLPTYGRHTEACLEHMRKITANETHRHDDRADTCYDAVKLGLIDKVIHFDIDLDNKSKQVASKILNAQRMQNNLRNQSWL